MMKLSSTTRNVAAAALLGTGLVASAGVTLTPVSAQAQMHRDWDGRYYSDRDDRYHRDWDDRYRGDWDDHYRHWDGREWVGIGVPGFGIGFYDYPYSSGYYAPYCSSYDYYDGYCTY